LNFVREKKGVGLIGVFLTLAIVIFFFTAFYIVLDNFYANFITKFAGSADTITYYDSTLHPVWMAIPFVFFFSAVLWGVIQSQNPFNVARFGLVWVVIVFSYFTFSMIYVAFDNFMMNTIPGLMPASDTIYSSVYTNFIKPLWRAVPLGFIVVLLLFGSWMATTYFEQGGRTYVARGGF